MTELVLDRFCYCEQGTFGRLYLPELSLFTVERPWAGNRPYVSCIPEGSYGLAPARFNRGGYDTYAIEGVPDRTHTLIHVANRAADVQGCVGLGMKLGCVNGDWAVHESKAAFARFMAVMAGLLPARILIRREPPQMA